MTELAFYKFYLYNGSSGPLFPAQKEPDVKDEIVDRKLAGDDERLVNNFENFDSGKRATNQGTDLGPGDTLKADRVAGDITIADQDIPVEGEGWKYSGHATPRD